MKDKSMAVKIESESESIPPTIHRELAKIVAASGHAAPNPALWVSRREAGFAARAAFIYGAVVGVIVVVLIVASACALWGIVAVAVLIAASACALWGIVAKVAK